MSESLPRTMKVTDYMLELSKELMEKKSIAETTAAAYLRILYSLNNKEPFKSLTFLKNTSVIDEKISSYAESTQKSLYSGVTSVLSLFKDKPTYKKVYQHYYDKMMGEAKKTRDTSVKTEKEKANWIDWEEVQKKRSELKEKVGGFVKQKVLPAAQWEVLLHSTLVALYTEVQPRRNQDYLDMWVVRSKKIDDLPKDKNYLVLEGSVPKCFIFNKFKTSKTYGQQIVEIPEALVESLTAYLKHHPLNKGSKKPTEFKFLVSADGSPLTAVNSITRVLNKVFGKKVGSSMLRHSFLSSKYGATLEAQKEDSNAMAHGLNQQRGYIRTGGSSEIDIPEAEGHE